MKFSFKAQKSTGEIYESERDAVDKFSLYKDLKKEGDTVLVANELRIRRKLDIGNYIKFMGRVGTHEKIIFARNLGNMMDAGLALSRALTVLERQTKKKKLKELLVSVNDNIKKGKTLSESLSNHREVFPQLFISMVRAGEEGGNLSSSLKMVALQIENVYNLEKRVRGAMMYPAIIFTVMIVIGILLMIFVVPTLTSTFKEFGGELPAATKLVIGVSDFLRIHFIASFLILLVVAGAIYSFLKTGFGKMTFDFAILRIPVIGGIVKEVNAARTARTLSSLLSAGVPVVKALEVTAEVLQNFYYKKILLRAQKQVETGSQISTILMEREDLYPPFLSEMTAVGEETGKISEMFASVATYFEKSVEEKTKDMSTVIEPFLMVLIGAVVGFFAYAMITPMYSLVSAIK